MPLEDVAMGVVAGAAFLREAPDSAAEGAATRRPIELLKLARNWREIGAKLAPDWPAMVAAGCVILWDK